MPQCTVVGCKNNTRDVCFYYRTVGQSRAPSEKKEIMCSKHFQKNAHQMKDTLPRRKPNSTAMSRKLPVNAKDRRLKERRKIVDDLLQRHAEKEWIQGTQYHRHAATQTNFDSSTTGELKRNLEQTNKFLDCVGWKVGQQQAEIIQMRRELARFRQFFTVEEADLIGKGQMVPSPIDTEYKAEEVPDGAGVYLPARNHYPHDHDFLADDDDLIELDDD